MIPNTEVYHTERYTLEGSFKYLIPFKKDGLYTLILKFSEVYFQQVQEKQFNILIGNGMII